MSPPVSAPILRPGSQDSVPTLPSRASPPPWVGTTFPWDSPTRPSQRASSIDSPRRTTRDYRYPRRNSPCSATPRDADSTGPSFRMLHWRSATGSSSKTRGVTASMSRAFHSWSPCTAPSSSSSTGCRSGGDGRRYRTAVSARGGTDGEGHPDSVVCGTRRWAGTAEGTGLGTICAASTNRPRRLVGALFPPSTTSRLMLRAATATRKTPPTKTTTRSSRALRR
mmetsp:Transcript_38640/g.116020  ORF Transcript_38640/g.116020 Transcript_38640/m.116020 type:complete len:224 (+) Transcript_38640:1016-1687(+)